MLWGLEEEKGAVLAVHVALVGHNCNHYLNAVPTVGKMVD